VGIKDFSHGKGKRGLRKFENKILKAILGYKRLKPISQRVLWFVLSTAYRYGDQFKGNGAV
jgi:hypothetical protein